MKIENININRIDSIFKESSIFEKLASGKKLVIKSGIDPTSTDIHFGHIVGLLLLRDLQRLGHKIVFVLGDFTAQLGDGVIRPKLGLAKTNENANKLETFLISFFKDGEFELHKQSEWFEKMPLEEFINLLSEVSVKKLLSHETFQEKIQAGDKFQAHELIYPTLMAFDSIQLKPDIEIGSLEQRFNLQFTRLMMKNHGVEPEDFILNARLPGIDGSDKMSKSQNNFIGVFEDLNTQIQKILSMKNEVVISFLRLLTNISDDDIDELNVSGDWLKIRMALAVEVLSLFHSRQDIELAWTRIVTQDEFEEVELSSISSMSFKEFIIKFTHIESNRELKRLIENKAIKVDSKQISLTELQTIELKQNRTIQIGKKFKFKLT